MNAALAVLTALGQKLLWDVLLNKRVLEWAFWWIVKRLVSSTSTPYDDEWYEKIKEEYDAVQERETT